MSKYVKPTSKRPSYPDGSKHVFNCCLSPDVWRTETEEYICRVCGHDWTDSL